MHLTVRVSLFYLLSFCFNIIYSFGVLKIPKSSISNYEYKLIRSALIDDSTVAILISIWPFIRLVASILIYKFMFRLAIPVEVERKWEHMVSQLIHFPQIPQLTRTWMSVLSKVSNLIFGGSFVYHQVLCDYLNWNDDTIIYMESNLRGLVFIYLTVCLSISLHLHGFSRAAVQNTSITFSYLACNYFPNIEFKLFKFAMIAFVFFHVFYNSNGALKMRGIAVKVASLVTGFSLIHASTLLLQCIYLRLNKDGNAEWTIIVNNDGIIVNNEGIIVIRVFLVFSLFSFLTISILKALQQLSPTYKYKFKQNFLKKMMISPVFFYLFEIDKIFWKLDSEQRIALLLKVVLLHLAALLVSLSHLIKTLLSTREMIEVRRAMGLALFTFISAISILAYSTRTFTYNPLMFLIILFALYHMLQVILLVSEFVLTNVKFINQNVNEAKYVQKIHFVVKVIFLLSVIAFMLQTFIFLRFGLSIFMGIIYYACVLFVQIRAYFSCLTEASQLELRSLKDACPICRKEMTSGYRTPCNHYYHQHCIRAWLDKSRTCPMCSSAVVKTYKIS